MKGTLFILQEYFIYASCLDFVEMKYAIVGNRRGLTPCFMQTPNISTKISPPFFKYPPFCQPPFLWKISEHATNILFILLTV